MYVHALQVPNSYLSLNWPINYACVGQDGRYLAVAGKAGMALYSSLNHKWKLFSNEQQEQSMVCRGGLAWWNDIVVFPCIVSNSNVEVSERRGGEEEQKGREDRGDLDEHICNRINQSIATDCMTFRPSRPSSTAYKTATYMLIKIYLRVVTRSNEPLQYQGEMSRLCLAVYQYQECL